MAEWPWCGAAYGNGSLNSRVARIMSNCSMQYIVLRLATNHVGTSR
jgi:hypothetical protein